MPVAVKLAWDEVENWVNDLSVRSLPVLSFIFDPKSLPNRSENQIYRISSIVCCIIVWSTSQRWWISLMCRIHQPSLGFPGGHCRVS